jgi:ATP/maltotriose-dependent transcriptional regulator MalT
MAIVTGVSIGTSNKVSVDYQSQEVSVSVSYQLERDDTDLMAFVQEKAHRARMTNETFAAMLDGRFGKRAVEQLTKQEAAQLQTTVIPFFLRLMLMTTVSSPSPSCRTTL